MAGNHYDFFTRWRVAATCEEVYEVLGDGQGLVRWWPSVYLNVETLAPGDESGVGKVMSILTKGWLPYTLRWRFEIVEVRPPHGFTLRAQVTSRAPEPGRSRRRTTRWSPPTTGALTLRSRF